MRDIIIKDHSKATPLVTPTKRFDIQDVMVIGGFVSLEIGVGAIYIPAALILAGLLCFLFASLIQRAKQAVK